MVDVDEMTERFALRRHPSRGASFIKVREKCMEIRAAVVGDERTGKTAFLERLLFEAQFNQYFPTILDLYSATGSVEFGNMDLCQAKRVKKYQLHLLDTSGQGVFDSVRPLAYRRCNSIFLFFSTTSRKSYNSLSERWIPELAYYTKSMQSAPNLVLVGTHIDQRIGPHDAPHLIFAREAAEYAKSIGARAYIEVNTLDTNSVMKAFSEGIATHQGIADTLARIQLEENDPNMMAKARVPRDALCAGHVGWADRDGFLVHSIPPDWKSFFTVVNSKSLNRISYPNADSPFVNKEMPMIEVSQAPRSRAPRRTSPSMVVSSDSEQDVGGLQVPGRPAARSRTSSRGSSLSPVPSSATSERSFGAMLSDAGSDMDESYVSDVGSIARSGGSSFGGGDRDDLDDVAHPSVPPLPDIRTLHSEVEHDLRISRSPRMGPDPRYEVSLTPPDVVTPSKPTSSPRPFAASPRRFKDSLPTPGTSSSPMPISPRRLAPLEYATAPSTAVPTPPVAPTVTPTVVTSGYSVNAMVRSTIEKEMGVVQKTEGELAPVRDRSDFYHRSEVISLQKKIALMEEKHQELTAPYFEIVETACTVMAKISSASRTERWAQVAKLVTAYNRAAEMRKEAGLTVAAAYQLLRTAKALMLDESNHSPAPLHVAQRYDLLGQTFQRMAWMLRCSEKLEPALICLEKAVEFEKASSVERGVLKLPMRPVPSASTHLHLSSLLSQLGRHVDALQHSELAIAKIAGGFEDCDDNMLLVMLGTPRRGTLAVAYHNVAVEQEFLRQYDRSLENYQKAFAMAEKELGADHHTTKQLKDSLDQAQSDRVKRSSMHSEVKAQMAKAVARNTTALTREDELHMPSPSVPDFPGTGSPSPMQLPLIPRRRPPTQYQSSPVAPFKRDAISGTGNKSPIPTKENIRNLILDQ